MSLVAGEAIVPEDFKGPGATFPVLETTVGTTHSLTTVANQRVMVWAKGRVTGNFNGRLQSLKYNGVTKDSVTADGGLSGSTSVPFSLMYTETPGAGTHDITVETSGGGSIDQVVIMVMKF